MKPGHSGLKTLDESAVREVGPSSGWVSYAAKPSTSGSDPHTTKALSGSGIQIHSRPPDPGECTSPNRSPSGSPNHSSDVVRAEDRGKGDGDQAARDMKDVEMKIGSAGHTGTHSSS